MASKVLIKNPKNNLNLGKIKLTSYPNKNSYEFIVSQIENSPINYKLKSDLIKILEKYQITSVKQLLNSTSIPKSSNSNNINEYSSDDYLLEKLKLEIKQLL